MARGSSKKASGEPNPEATERKRLKKLAFFNNLLSETRAKSYSSLSPSKAVVKHHGKDILKKSQRKNRFLFSFPGLLAPIGGGKIGELKDLGTKNPILYLDFPQGRIKLFGTIVYPKNKYLTLQFPRGGKNVMCEDSFDNMIVFTDTWWIGRKDENPEEARLNFPKELNEGQCSECDFKGGAGAASMSKHSVMTETKNVEDQSLKIEVGDDLSDTEDDLKDSMKVTPIRHSERSAGKTFKFVEVSSGDDTERSSDISEGEEKKFAEVDTSSKRDTFEKKKSLCSRVLDIDRENAAMEKTPFPKQNQVSSLSTSTSKNLSQLTRSPVQNSNQGSLVQATISTLFKKVEEKKAPRDSKKAPSRKVSGQKLLLTDSKKKIHQDGGTKKRKKVTKGKDDGGEFLEKKKEYEVKDEVEDDIEVFSSTQEDTDDEDWAA